MAMPRFYGYAKVLCLERRFEIGKETVMTSSFVHASAEIALKFY